MLKINTQLNIVLPLDIEGAPQAEVPVFQDGKPMLAEGKPVTRLETQPYWVYAPPLSMEVFRRFWLVFSKTFAKIYNEGLHVTAGPRIAAYAMRDIAQDLGLWEGEEGVEHGVMDQIRRVSTIIIPTPDKGWQKVPLQDAVNSEFISEENVSEVENILTFFTVISAMHRAGERRAILEGAARLWDAQITLSDCSAFAASLPKLTETGRSGVRIVAG